MPLVALAGAALLATTTYGQVSWAQSYGARSFDANGAPINSGSQGSGSDTATGIARMPDGGFVVAGQLELPEVYRNVFNAAAGLHRNGGAGSLRRRWDHSVAADAPTG